MRLKQSGEVARGQVIVWGADDTVVVSRYNKPVSVIFPISIPDMWTERDVYRSALAHMLSEIGRDELIAMIGELE